MIDTWRYDFKDHSFTSQQIGDVDILGELVVQIISLRKIDHKGSFYTLLIWL